MSIIFYEPIGWAQLLLIALTAYQGTKQYIMAKNGIAISNSFVIPLGVMCLIFGLIGFFVQLRQAFEAIEIAGDLSPQIIAGGIKQAYDFPILGLIGLGISYAFKYINSNIVHTEINQQ